MTADEFQRALASADTMALAGRAPAYWCGFKRGLQRAHLGRRFTTNTDHYAWLDFARDVDPFVAQLGRGYRAGLQAVASGRPLVLDGADQAHERRDPAGHDHLHDQAAAAAADDRAAATGADQKP